ncbi:MAG: hypothetical protein KA797_00275, partial [Chitinophagales bacterium]|nr:hypothetical protein [Chitinophagales bacterium]
MKSLYYLAILFSLNTLQAQTVSTVSGSGVAGVLNGTGTAARHHFPGSVVVDSLGNLYTSDYLGNTIRKITPAGVVTTFAGSGAAGSADGTGTAASFYFPWGMAIDGSGNIIVADQGNHKIRKITMAGIVTTIAGSGALGSANGAAAGASFNKPTDVTVDAAGNIYIADQWNDMVRKLSTAGIVSTLAGSGAGGWADGPGATAQFNRPSGIALD